MSLTQLVDTFQNLCYYQIHQDTHTHHHPEVHPQNSHLPMNYFKNYLRKYFICGWMSLSSRFMSSFNLREIASLVFSFLRIIFVIVAALTPPALLYSHINFQCLRIFTSEIFWKSLVTILLKNSSYCSFCQLTDFSKGFNDHFLLLLLSLAHCRYGCHPLCCQLFLVILQSFAHL